MERHCSQEVHQQQSLLATFLKVRLVFKLSSWCQLWLCYCAKCGMFGFGSYCIHKAPNKHDATSHWTARIPHHASSSRLHQSMPESLTRHDAMICTIASCTDITGVSSFVELNLDIHHSHFKCTLCCSLSAQYTCVCFTKTFYRTLCKSNEFTVLVETNKLTLSIYIICWVLERQFVLAMQNMQCWQSEQRPSYSTSDVKKIFLT